MNWQTMEVIVQDSVATVFLNRPAVRNAFDDLTIAELTQVFRELGESDGIRVIVLAARGLVFCAGADLHWMKRMAGYTPEENRADAACLASMLHTVYTCPKPVVACVQGDCYAGGMGLVAACDVVVAVETAHFCLSEVRLGLIPATIAPYVLRMMGENAARRYMLTAERFSAHEAHRIGLVQVMAAPDRLEAAVGEIVNVLRANSPHAMKEAKRLVREVAGMPLNDALIADTVDRIAAIRASEEGQEGIGAFLEKRRPAWLD